ncbi:hypothetical protein C2E23DRAFT_800286 [Lenzites betulinus]|nr:hypothetical protein C2E23DRAFT_800286 [Lenzites betulinus]
MFSRPSLPARPRRNSPPAFRRLLSSAPSPWPPDAESPTTPAARCSRPSSVRPSENRR